MYDKNSRAIYKIVNISDIGKDGELRLSRDSKLQQQAMVQKLKSSFVIDTKQSNNDQIKNLDFRNPGDQDFGLIGDEENSILTPKALKESFPLLIPEHSPSSFSHQLLTPERNEGAKFISPTHVENLSPSKSNTATTCTAASTTLGKLKVALSIEDTHYEEEPSIINNTQAYASPTHPYLPSRERPCSVIMKNNQHLLNQDKNNSTSTFTHPNDGSVTSPSPPSPLTIIINKVSSPI